MNSSPLARQPRRVRTQLPTPAGGLILVGGPPFHGKSVLAARLADILPFAHKLEVVDTLRSGAEEHWLPHGMEGPPQLRPLRAMLDAAVRAWKRGTPHPIVVVAARAGTPAARRLAHRRAEAEGIKFLYVESKAHTIRAFQRLSALSLPKEELIRVMHRYEQALARYEPIDGLEMKTLPALRLNMVLTDVDGAARAVLSRWATL